MYCICLCLPVVVLLCGAIIPSVRSISPLNDVNPVQTLSAWTELLVSHKKILRNFNATFVTEVTDRVYPHLLKWSSNEEKKFNECQRSFYNLSRSLVKRDPVAIRVLDSMGKIESGLLTGNIRWTGRYHECIEASTSAIETKWCTFNIGGNPKDKVQLTTDASLSIGLCIPQSCSEDNLNNALSSLIAFTNISVQVKCPIQPTVWTGVDIFSVVVVVTLVLFLVIGTCTEVYYQNTKLQLGGGVTSSLPQLSGWRKVLISFSIIINSRNLLSTDRKPDEIICLNGMRFLSMAWVVLGHTYATSLVYIDNILDVGDNLVNKATLQAVANANFAVDSFFFLSGLLVAYLIVKRLENFSVKQVVMAYVQRYIRLTPAYAFLILCVVGFIGKVGDGPRWPEAYSEMHTACKKYWWTNLLYVNNLYPAALLDECYALGWYLANDMQFFILAPISLFILKWKPWVGITSLVFGVFSSMLVTGILSSHYHIQPSPVAIAAALKKAHDASHNSMDPPGLRFQPIPNASPFWSDTYAKPWCRIGVYLIGMITGYILQRYKNRIQLPKVFVALGCIIFLALNITLVYGLWGHVHNTSSLNVHVAALYDALCRPLWAATLSWIVLICVAGYGGPVNAFLGWKAFLPLSRLTYCTYLVHPLIIAIWFGTLETNIHYSDTQFAFFFLALLSSALAGAYVVSMLVEVPFMNIGKMLLPNRRTAGHEDQERLLSSEASLHGLISRPVDDDALDTNVHA